MFEDEDDFGLSEGQLDDKREAVKRYEEMLRDKKDYFFDVDALNLIIDHYFEIGQFFLALEVSNYAIKLHPSQYDLILRQATLMAKTGNEKGALDVLKKYEEINPVNPDLYLLRANIYCNLNEFLNAIDNFHTAIQFNDDPVPIYHDLSFAYADAGDYDNAIKYMKKYLKSGWQDTLAYDQLINWLTILERLEAELPFFQEQIDNDPYSDSAWLAMAMVCKELKLYDKALHALDYCILISTENIQAYLEQGDVFFLMDRYAEAIKSYENSLDFFPGNAITYYNIGECYERLNDYEKARENYARSIRLYPDLSAAWYSIGMVLSYQDKYYEAIHYLKKSVELEPNNAEFWFALADCESSLNHFNEAIACYENVVDLEPDNEDVYVEYSLFLFENNQLQDALETIATGIKILPGNAEHYYYNACYLYADGKLKAAYEELITGLTKDNTIYPIIFDVIPELKNDEKIMEIIQTYKP